MKYLKCISQGSVHAIAGILLPDIPPLFVSAEDQKEAGGDLRAAVQNHISSIASLPFEFNFDLAQKTVKAIY